MLLRKQTRSGSLILLNAVGAGVASPKHKRSSIGPGSPRNKHAAARSGKQLWDTVRHVEQVRSLQNGTQSFKHMKLVRNLPIFWGCSPEFINAVSHRVQHKAYKDGQTIAREGTLASSMYWVLTGCIEVILMDHVVMTLEPGQYFGEAAVLGLEDHWVASLKSKGPTVVCEVTRGMLTDTLKEHEAEMAKFSQILRRNQACMQWGAWCNPCELFHGLSESALRLIDKVLVRRILFPGEKLLEEGQPGDKLCIAVHGSLSVHIAGRQIREEHVGAEPLCFGELGFFGIQRHQTATLVAESVCYVRVLYRAHFQAAMATQGDETCKQFISRFKKRRFSEDVLQEKEMKTLSEVEVFRKVGCCKEFLEFLTLHLEDRIFLTDQMIIDEQAPDDKCMFIIADGTATVLRDGNHVATLTAGDVCGVITALGLDSKRSATVIAMENCRLHILHQKVVVRALEVFPEERRKVLMMAFAQKGIIRGDHDPNVDPAEVQLDFKQAFMNALKASELFSTLGQQFIEKLSTLSEDRIYLPGDLITQEGAKGESMFIMVSGVAEVYMTDTSQMPCTELQKSGASGRTENSEKHKVFNKKAMSMVGILTVGSISGELSMLGISPIRSATIEAQTICCMWECEHHKVLQLLDRYPDCRNHFRDIILRHLQHTVPVRILSMPLFSGFDKKFRMLLSLYCECRVYFPGQLIAKENQGGDRLWIINLGRAVLEKKGITVKMYNNGNCFGSHLMLETGTKVYPGSLIALQTCHLLAISRSAYLQALDQYPSTAAASRLVAQEKLAFEELNETINRVAQRKMIWKRYGTLMRHGAGPETSDHDTLKMCFQEWLSVAIKTRALRLQRRKEREQSKLMMDQWIEKKRAAIERNRLRREEELKPALVARERSATQLPTLSSGWTAGRGQASREQLPQLRPLSKEWPKPRPSPFYKLKVWDVLAKVSVMPVLALIERSGSQERLSGVVPSSSGLSSGGATGDESARSRQSPDAFEFGDR